MAITFVAVTTAGDGNGASLTGIARASTTTDDLNILDMYLESGTAEGSFALAFSNGTWVQEQWRLQVGSTIDFTHIRYREVYAGAGATFNVTWSGGVGAIWRGAIVTAYRGVNTTTPDDATATSAAGAASDSTAIAPTITTVTASAWLIYGEADFDGRTAATYTSPLAERSDFGNLAVADGEQTSAGASGAKQSTLSGATWWTAGLIALKPAGAAAATSMPPAPPAYALQPLLGR